MHNVHDVAVKVLKSLSSPRDLGLLQREVSVLRSCNNKNIVQFYGVCFREVEIWLIMELLDKGTLYNALERGKQQLTWYHR